MHPSTLDYYNTHAAHYIARTQYLQLTPPLQDFLSLFSPHARILDVGCGSGRDALYFQTQGLRVTAIDTSLPMVQATSQLLDSPAYLMDIRSIPWQSRFDGVWCMASLLHLNNVEMTQALSKIALALKPGGYLFLGLKEGIGQYIESDTGRFFQLYSQQHIQTLLAPHFYIESNTIVADALGRTTQWLNVFARKR
jgi:SAM-dependent methyltransferase